METQLQNQNKMSTFVIKCCVYLYFSSSTIAKSIKNLKFNNMAIKLRYYCVLKEAKWVIKWQGGELLYVNPISCKDVLKLFEDRIV